MSLGLQCNLKWRHLHYTICLALVGMNSLQADSTFDYLGTLLWLPIKSD